MDMPLLDTQLIEGTMCSGRAVAGYEHQRLLSRVPRKTWQVRKPWSHHLRVRPFLVGRLQDRSLMEAWEYGDDGRLPRPEGDPAVWELVSSFPELGSVGPSAIAQGSIVAPRW